MSKTLRLNTVKNTRNAISRLSREFYRNADVLDRDNAWWRTLTGMLKEVLSAHKLEKELDIEKRLTAIEDALKDRGFNI